MPGLPAAFNRDRNRSSSEFVAGGIRDDVRRAIDKLERKPLASGSIGVLEPTDRDAHRHAHGPNGGAAHW